MRNMQTNKFKQYAYIITIDSSNGKSYKFYNQEITPCKLTNFKKDNFYISTITSKNIVTDSIEVSRNIPDEDLQSAIDVQVYDELNLDPAIEYTIYYKEFFGFEDNSKRKFNIFAIETEKLKEEFGSIVKKIKYIDYILPESLLFKSIYRKNLLEKDSIDCFLYFKQQDAFLAIYADGEYIYSKSINYSLERMHEKFCEITGENYPYDDFINYIKVGSSSNISEDNQRLIIKLYKEIFVYVNDVIFYAKRAYLLENIDKIYVNSSIGMFKNIDKYIRTYLDIEPHELNFSIAKNAKEINSEQLHNLMVIAAIDYIEEPDDTLNFSIFKRPPPFGQRAVGKVFYIFLLSLALSLAYPAYQLGYTYLLKAKMNSLKIKERKLNIKANNIKNQLLQLNKEREIIKKKFNKEFTKLNFREKLLNQIYSKKVNYPIKVKLLIEIFKNLDIYNCKIYNVKLGKEKTGKMFMIFSLFSRNDKKITEFIKSLTKIKSYGVSTKEIKKDPKQRLYLSDVKVVLK